MKLYFASNTCSLSPHIVMQELGIEYDLIRVNNATKRTSDGKDFLTINPKGYVAALQLDSGEVLTEGPVLLQYLADLKPEAHLAPKQHTLARLRLQEWLNFITSELHAGSAPLFNAELPESVRELFRAKLRKRLNVIELELSQKNYLMGSEFCVADAYLYTVLTWMQWFSIDLEDWPCIVEYKYKIEARESVIAALKREAIVPAA
ncbi:glutathione transferase GstA [Vibrio sp. MEBiC08052]|uniref:glutathione transferase GstA n=1 Tax=Vibrio sp. MEBiC08052 TaxID=1761910 RepID=UPI000740DCB4|nr:glutathione transferase GstA [Vibrio sp. MEBiC08052]